MNLTNLEHIKSLIQEAHPDIIKVPRVLENTFLDNGMGSWLQIGTLEFDQTKLTSMVGYISRRVVYEIMHRVSDRNIYKIFYDMSEALASLYCGQPETAKRILHFIKMEEAMELYT